MSEPADPALLEALREVARAREGGGADALVLSNREDGPVVRCGATVVKAHASETDPELLRARIGVVTASELRELFLQPLLDEPLVVRGRLVTVWPGSYSGRLMTLNSCSAARVSGPEMPSAP